MCDGTRQATEWFPGGKLSRSRRNGYAWSASLRGQATRIESARKGESNQSDRWFCFRSGFPRVFILPENARRQSIPGARGWRRTRAEGAEGRERVAPHILLISVSIVVSVGTPSVRVARPTSERDHPSSCPPFRSRPTLPLSLAKSSLPPVRHHRSQPLVYTRTVLLVARIDDAARNRETTIRCDTLLRFSVLEQQVRARV